MHLILCIGLTLHSFFNLYWIWFFKKSKKKRKTFKNLSFREKFRFFVLYSWNLMKICTPHEVIIFLKIHEDSTKNVDFYKCPIFEHRYLGFFAQTLPNLFLNYYSFYNFIATKPWNKKILFSKESGLCRDYSVDCVQIFWSFFVTPKFPNEIIQSKDLCEFVPKLIKSLNQPSC